MTTPNQNLPPAVRGQSNYTLTEVEKVGIWIAKSGAFSCKNPEHGMVIAFACREKGMTLFEFLDRYHVMFDGRIKLKSHAVHAEFRKAGGKIVWIKSGDDGKAAEADVTFEGQTVRLSYTMEQAVKQQLVKRDGNWDKTPGNMLRARLITNAIGMLCPEIYLSGGDDEGPAHAPLALGTPHAPIEIITYDPTDAKQVREEAVGAAIETSSQPTAARVIDDSNPELQPVAKPSAPTLPDELLTKLAVTLAEVGEDAAVAFCRSINWLKEGETMANLSVANAKYICAKHEAFAAKAKAFATKATA